MSEVWNSWQVKQPPVCTIKMVLHRSEINKLKQLLFEVLKSLRSANCLNKEAATLSRYLFKSKRTFRHDKGMQNLVKIHQCLKRYLKLNLIEVINTYKETFPSKFPEGRSHAYLPSKQMLMWVLLRLQAFSQIFARLIELSKVSGSYYYGKLLLGWSLNSTLFVFALIARILTLSKFMANKAIEWYNSLHRYLPFFEQTAEFLPGYRFPTELKKWLGDVDLTPPKKKTSIDEIFELIDLVKDDDDDDESGVKICNKNLIKSLFRSEVIEIDSDVEEIKDEDDGERGGIKKPPPAPKALNLEDVGVPIGDDNDEIQELEPPTKKYKTNFERKNNRFKERGRRGNVRRGRF